MSSYHAAVRVSDDAQHAIIKGAKAFEAKSATGEAIYGKVTDYGPPISVVNEVARDQHWVRGQCRHSDESV